MLLQAEISGQATAADVTYSEFGAEFVSLT